MPRVKWVTPMCSRRETFCFAPSMLTNHGAQPALKRYVSSCWVIEHALHLPLDPQQLSALTWSVLRSFM